MHRRPRGHLVVVIDGVEIVIACVDLHLRLGGQLADDRVEDARPGIERSAPLTRALSAAACGSLRSAPDAGSRSSALRGEFLSAQPVMPSSPAPHRRRGLRGRISFSPLAPSRRPAFFLPRLCTQAEGGERERRGLRRMWAPTSFGFPLRRIQERQQREKITRG